MQAFFEIFERHNLCLKTFEQGNKKADASAGLFAASL
jgi:hypothetical protein